MDSKPNRSPETLDGKFEHTAHFLEAFNQVIETSDFSLLLQTIVDRGAVLSGASAGALYLTDTDQKVFLLAANRGKFNNFASGIPISLLENHWDLLQNGQPVILENLLAWQPGSPAGVESVPAFTLAVPFLWQAKVTAILFLYFQDGSPEFAPASLELIRLFAGQAAVVIENVRLLESERRQRKEAETLCSTATAITSTLSLEQVLDRILIYLEKVIPYDSSTIFLLEGSYLTGKAGRGFNSPEMLLGNQFPADDALFQEVRQSSRTLVLEDARTDPRFQCWAGTDYARSWMGIPLIANSEVIGYLTCDHREKGIYTPKSAALGEAFASQAALAITNARLYEAEGTQLLVSQTLQEVGALLTSELSLKQVLEKILDLLGKVVHYDSASLQLLDNQGRLQMAAGRGFPDIDLARKIVNNLSSHTLDNYWEQAIIDVIPDTWNDKRWINYPGSEYIRSWIGVPLLVKGRFIGALNVDSKTPGAFNAQYGETVIAFANQAAIAIENARLFEAERTARARAEALMEAARVIGSSLSLPEVLDLVLEQMQQVLPYDSANVMLVQGSRICVSACRGYEKFTDSELARTSFFEIEQSTTVGAVVRQNRPVVIVDTHSDPRWSHREVSRHIRSWLGIPLSVRDQVIGILSLDRVEPGEFREEEVQLAQSFAVHTAAAIENAQLFERAAKERRHLSLLYDVGRELTRSLDPYSILHSAITLTRRALDGLAGHAFLYDAGENRLRLSAVISQNDELIDDLDRILDMKPGVGLEGWVALHCTAANIPDVFQDSRWKQIAEVNIDIQAAISAPILDGERLLGVLTILHSRKNAFDSDHLDLLEAICQELGLALSNAKRYQQVERRLAEITLIQNLSQTFTQRLEIPILLNEVVAQLSERLDYPQVEIYILEDEKLVLKAFRGKLPASGLYSIDTDITGQAVRSRQAILALDLSQNPDFVPGIPGTAAELVVPIFRGDAVLGAIHISSDCPGQLSQQDRNLVEVLAGQISIAYENATLYEHVLQHAEDLEKVVAQRTAELMELFRLSEEIGYCFSHKELLRLLLHHVHSAIQGQLTAACLITTDYQGILVETNQAFNMQTSTWIRAACQDVFAGDAGQVETLKHLEVELLDEGDYHSKARPFRKAGSFIQAPIVVERKIVGVLIVAQEHAEGFGTEQNRLLTTFANQAGAAVQRLAAVFSAQHKHLESLVEHLPMGILLLDADFNLLVSNPVGKEIVRLLNPNDHSDKLFQLGSFLLPDLIQQHRDSLPFEIAIEGEPQRLFSVQIHQVRGSLPRFVFVIREITREREHQNRIQNQERLATVGQLAAGIAHDFNNIMAAILVYADLLFQDPDIHPSSQEKLKIIQQQVQRAASLIRQILDFSRRSVMEQSALDLLPFVKELDKMLIRVLPETIRLDLSYQPGSYWIEADPTRLQQVFMNLALNARDAMPQGGLLHFGISRISAGNGGLAPLPNMSPGDWIRIDVSDSGVGIPPEILPHIYDPFFTTKPVGKGTGLGLAQVYGIIQQHKGQIEVTSKENKGTTFSIFLPELDIHSQGNDPLQDAAVLKGKGERVLVVEDDDATREAIRALLEAQNYEVITACNGVEALDLFDLHTQSVGLVISDVVMPEMGGIALYRALQERSPGIKMLFMTGHPLETNGRILLEKGPVNWIQKPFTMADFNQAIKFFYGG